MKLRLEWFRTVRKAAGFLPALLVICGWIGSEAQAEERKFAVMLAHSPKSFATGGVPGLPPGGLENVETIRKDYFDTSLPNIDSFAEYWDEISYGDVQVTGQVLGWVSLPWAFDPNPPNAAPRPAPIDFINLHGGSLSCGIGSGVPAGFAYGAGENFCDCFGSGDAGTAITTSKCGKLIITDDVGNPPIPVLPPTRKMGLDDRPVTGGRSVWTPGERFADIDGDNRWDSIDEKNDMMCLGADGCKNVCRGSDQPCGGSVRCPTGEPCLNDPPGSGPRSCNFVGCGDLAIPCIDWNDDGNCENDNQICPLPGTCSVGGNPCNSRADCDPDPTVNDFCVQPFQACTSDADCLGIRLDNIGAGGTPSLCIFRVPGQATGFCQPAECFVPREDQLDDNDPLPPCKSDSGENDPDDAIDGKPGVTCGTPNLCCEFDDVDGDNSITVPEPFEDFMVRWNPNSGSPSGVWVPVTEKYIADNYPGDVNALKARTGNGIYDSPDLFIDRGTTKMMQDAGVARFIWKTPKPGTMKATRQLSPTSGFATEEAWFDQFWTDRYGSTSTPPDWPGGNNNVVFNSPRMRPFDPANPVPPAAAGTPGRRWFKANRGGWNGRGLGTAEDPFIRFDVGGDSFDAAILPEEVFGYYDGWVEHDDLPSSKYHSEGDKRLGEITSPGTDTVGGLAAIFGADLGQHDPNSFVGPDGINVAAGPYAVNIHGANGFDAGDVCILEWLTWRTDGTSFTVGNQWALDNGTYHPYARSAKGFRDYNLDGMIDQGEVRPERSANYSADSFSGTSDDGTNSIYPFNRRRLVEDVVEALDASTSWDTFIDPNSMEAVECVRGASSGAQGFVSGIVLVPQNSYSNINLFPTAPSFHPIHNEDNDDPTFMVPPDATKIHQSFNLHFHDLVTCMDCRSPAPSVVPYAAHEYGHTWQGFPDLYDYGIFDNPQVDDINCPIGAWDIMAGARGAGSLVHPNPVLKSNTCTAWVEPVDLTTILTPGVETTITLPRTDLVKNDSYFFLENDARPGERYYFWSTGRGFDANMPGEGMLIMKNEDIGANPEAVALQQRTSPFNFRMVQGDGRGDLEACSSSGNIGDAGDTWPGSSGNTEFNFDSTPSATWSELNRWTGLDISNIVPDGLGNVAVTLTWVPTNIPSLRFIDPPGGESVGSKYQIRFEATDLHGGTTIKLYYTEDKKSCSGSGNSCNTAVDCGNQELCRHDTDLGSPEVHFIDAFKKTTTGTGQLSLEWDLAAPSVPDGRYVLFAKLNPGEGADLQTEAKSTNPRAGNTNVGDGSLTLNSVAIDDDPIDTDDKARVETWTVVCVNAQDQTWRVNSNLTQPVLDINNPNDDYPLATTDVAYTSAGGEVTFTVAGGSTAFALDDIFSFTTTGITTVSEALTVTSQRVSEGPIAVLKASPLSGPPELFVRFDALDSSDPNGEPLTFAWDFDGNGTQDAIGAVVNHTYRKPGDFTATLTAVNTISIPVRFDQTSVTINVFNNSPNASISADTTIGPSPLTVEFSAAESNDGSETPVDKLVYQWDFGDGQGANDQKIVGLQFRQVTHVYQGSGCSSTSPCKFTATLTVTDSNDESDTASIQIVVGNRKPNAVVSHSNARGVAPLEVVFNAIESTDPDPGDTELLMVEWRWDDGTNPEILPIFGAAGSSDGSVSHVFVAEGSFEVTATVFDEGDGRDDWAGVTVVVTAPVEESSSPRAAFSIVPSTAIVALGDPVNVDAGASFDRPVSDSSSAIASYAWNWGDGTAVGSGETAEHTYASAGTFRIRLIVTDLEGNTGTTSKNVTVLAEGEDIPDEGSAPIASFTVDPDQGFENGTVFTFDASASSDADGDPLTYTWDFGDGTVLNDSDIIVTHRYTDVDTFVIRLTVRDNTNRESSMTRQIEVLDNAGNLQPVAVIGTGVRSGSAPLTIIFDGRNSFDPNREDTLVLLWEFRRADNTLLSSQNGAIVTQTFENEGSFTVELIVSDGRGGQSIAGPETIVVAARFSVPDPGTEQPTPDDDTTSQPTGGGICGLGMVMGLFSSLFGLSLIRLSRGRRRRNR